MGLRSWYTPVYTYETFKKVVKSIKKNPYAYGIHFILKLNKDASPFKAKGLLIAWSGDGSSSLEHLKPLESRAETCLLDNLSSKFIKNNSKHINIIFNTILILIRQNHLKVNCDVKRDRLYYFSNPT